MKSVLKKAAVIALMSGTSLAIVAVPSYAFIGAVTGNIPLIAIGIGADLAGAAIGVTGARSSNQTILDLSGLSSEASLLLGLVLLDDKGQVSPHFTALDASSAAKLGITADEVNDYNSQLDQINAIYQTVSLETLEMSKTDSSVKDLSRYADQRWQEFGNESLTEAAQSALNKVRANMVAKLSTASK